MAQQNTTEEYGNWQSLRGVEQGPNYRQYTSQ